MARRPHPLTSALFGMPAAALGSALALGRTLSVALVLALALAGTNAQADTARGTVFEDANGDGVRSAGETGVAGVRVSNGRSIVKTDADGRYEIDLEPGEVLFITKPSGWMTPVDAHQLPRFYYVYSPEGSPKLRYPGVAPTGPLPEAIDFALVPREEASRFEVILFADPQPQSEIELGYLRDDIVAELIGTDALFGMTMGDILFDDLSFFPRSNAVIAQIGVPWYNVPGNHELNLDAANDAESLETFKRFFGPPYYSFEVADAVFYVLDNIDYQGAGESDPADFRRKGSYEARIGKRQLDWLKRDLQSVPDDRLVFLAMHAPLRTYLGDYAGANTQDRKKLFDVLRGREHLYAVAGHTHTTEHHYFGEDDGFRGPGEFHHHVLTTGSGSWWSGPVDPRGVAAADQRDGTPNGYHVLEVDGVETTVRYKAASKPADFQMRIMIDSTEHLVEAPVIRQYRPGELLDGQVRADAIPPARVLVNLFDGGPKSKVAYVIDDGAPVEMTRTSMIDPFVNELYVRHPDETKPWVKAMPSSHMFVAPLPADLSPGTYTLSVQAVDEFGRTHHGHRVLEIIGSSGR